MARILVCVSNDTYLNGKYRIGCFYEQFLNALQDCGNDILYFCPNEFNSFCFNTENELQPPISREILEKEIIEFNPEIIFAFNNATYDNLLAITNCPIILWGADSFWLWNQKDTIKKNLDRYLFFCLSEVAVKDLKDNLPKIEDNQVYLVPAGTSLCAEKVDQNINISFIGTNFDTDPECLNFINKYKICKLDELKELLNATKVLGDTISIKNNNKYENLEKTSLYSEFMKCDFSFFFAKEKRINELNSLVDLGLHLYGSGWDKLYETLPSLSLCYIPTFIYTAKQNQNIYNASKLCLNSQHSQAKNGMAWRVLDIMATNGCLLSEESTAVRQLFKGFDLPMFTNPYEERELCIKLLKNTNLRQDIVAKSNEIIEQEYTWKKRFLQIQKIIGFPLICEKTGNLEKLFPKYNKALMTETLKNKTLKNKVFYKVWKHLDKNLRAKGLIQ